MKVHDFHGFPNPARVRIAIAEKGLGDQVEFVNVDVPAGAHRAPEFMEKNPDATVPLLELDDGTCISQCTAITEYLDHATGEPTLTGQTAKERATIHMMQRRAEADLLDAVGAYFHHATPGLGPEIEKNQNAAWGESNKKRAVRSMHYFDGVLANQPYVAGDAFSMADITAFAGLGFAEFAKIDVPEGLSNLASWKARVAARPSIAHA